mmetsp:Transcript_11834/g.21013  ORF Transcript_11834/g.21013 Transcript_11834/m.21013 type:complete len:415 (-) Transcript_11834:187-1431(-)
MPAFHAKYFPEKCHVGDYWYYAMRTEWQNTHKRMKNTILKHPASKYVLDSYKPTGAGDLPSILKNVSLSNVTSTDNVFGSVSQTSPGKPSGFSSNSEPSASSKKCLDAEEFNNFCNSKGKSQPSPSAPKKHDRQEDEYGDARDAPDQGRYKEASNKKSRVNPPGREKEGGMPMDCISFKTDEDMSTCQGSFAAMSCATADIPVMNCSDKARACSSKFLSELAEKNAPVGCPVIRIEDSGDRKAQELMSHLISLQGRTETFNHATEAIDTASKYLKQIGRQRMQAEEMDAELARENAELKSKLKMNKSKMVENGTYKNVLNGAGNRCRAAAAKAEVVLELFEMNKPVVDKNGRMSKGDSKTWKAMFKRCIAANIDVGAIGEKIKKMFYRKRDQSESSYKFDPPRTKPSYNSDFGK